MRIKCAFCQDRPRRTSDCVHALYVFNLWWIGRVRLFYPVREASHE